MEFFDVLSAVAVAGRMLSSPKYYAPIPKENSDEP